ncbi:hypothetical protein GCM10027049_02030 [Mucilaginibacter puniceus]
MKKLYKLSILILIVCSGNKMLAQNKSEVITYITGQIEKSNNTDSVVLWLNGPFTIYNGPSENNVSKILTEKPDQKGVFKFKIRTENSPFHFTLFKSNKRSNSGNLVSAGDVRNYLIEPGDSVNIKFDGDRQLYSGRGTKLFEAQLQISEVDPGDKQLMSSAHNYFNINTKKWLAQKDSLLDAQLKVLYPYKTDMSPMAYGIIRADIIGKNRTFLYRRISFAGPFFVSGEPLKKDIQDLLIELDKRPPYVDQSDRSALTPEYILYLYYKIRTAVKYQRIINHVDPFINENYFDAINSNYTGLLRDKLLTYWLISISSFNHLDESYISHALSVMESPNFIKMVNDLKETFSSGQPVNDFDFQNTKGQIVRLSNFRGKVIVIDLWFSGCGPCLDVANGLRQVEKKFEKLKDVAFLSISSDKDKSLWLKSIDKKQKEKSASYFISDHTNYLFTSGTGHNNSFIKKYVPQESYPCLMLIDKKGRIFTSTPSLPITNLGREKLIMEINQALTD